MAEKAKMIRVWPKPVKMLTEMPLQYVSPDRYPSTPLGVTPVICILAIAL
jgi:hypothetical protein